MEVDKIYCSWDEIPDWESFGTTMEFICRNGAQALIFGMQPTFSQMIIELQKFLHFKDEIIWLYRDGGAGNTKGTGLKNVHQNIAWFSGKRDDYRFNIDNLRIPYQPNERNKYPVKRGNRIWTPNPKGAYPPNIIEQPKHKELIKGKTQFHKHYTIKPLGLIKKLILGFSNEGDLVLDPFMGTGTTALACLETNRRYIGFEINQEYVDIANKRLEQENITSFIGA